MHNISKQNIITFEKKACYAYCYILLENIKYLILVMRITLYTHNHMHINVQFYMVLVEGVSSLLLYTVRRLV